MPGREGLCSGCLLPKHTNFRCAPTYCWNFAVPRDGQGERDKLSLISEGQQKQVGVLGPESTVKLRQIELMLDIMKTTAPARTIVESLTPRPGIREQYR
jgi:hypothetical protein